jgi:hypothetical protein
LSPRAVVAGLGALAAAVLVIGIVGLGATGGSARQRARPPSTSTAPATSSSSTTTTVPSCVVGTRVPVARPPAAGACPHAISVEPGGAVVVDGRRAVVGRRGDEVLVGDWGCGGVAAAVLHLETGEALVYAPLDGDAPVVAMAERVAGATGLGAGVDDDGCPTLLVRTEEGSIRLT